MTALVEPAPRVVQEIRVSSSTSVADLSGVISRCHRENKQVVLVAIGTSAVNQAVKAAAAANGKDASHGRISLIWPALVDAEITDEHGRSVTRTTVRLLLVPYVF